MKAPTENKKATTSANAVAGTKIKASWINKTINDFLKLLNEAGS